MGIRTILIIAVFVWAMAITAQAETTHRVSFTQPAKVVTWTSERPPTSGHAVSVFGARQDQTLYPVLTGRLEPIDASASIQTDQARFSVATNAPFVIELDPSTLAPDAMFSLRLVFRGANAAAPVFFEQSFDRATLRTDAVLFRQDSRTAIGRGTLESQALTFEITAAGGADLSGLYVRATAP